MLNSYFHEKPIAGYFFSAYVVMVVIVAPYHPRFC